MTGRLEQLSEHGDQFANSFVEPLPSFLVTKDVSPDLEVPVMSHKSKSEVLPSQKLPSPEKKKKARMVQYKETLEEEGTRPGNEKRRRQLERNRKSAKESRRRKKQYIQQLEVQVSLRPTVEPRAAQRSQLL